MKKPTKKLMITAIQEANEEYIVKFPEKIITRIYFRTYMKEHDIGFYESDYITAFGGFPAYRTAAKIELKKEEVFSREDFDIIKDESKKSKYKKYFVSAIIAGAPIDEKFMNSVRTYCKLNETELLLLVMRGVKVGDCFTEDVFNKYGSCFVTEIKFNSNLKAMDFLINPSMIIPLTGLKRFGSKGSSVIVASPKQFLESVPQKHNKLPHIVLTTGTVCTPSYTSNRQGRLATQDNLVGGLIVEVRDSEIFHVRQIQSDKRGGFQDLDRYYRNDICQKVRAEAILSEPHYGVEDDIAIATTKEIIRQTSCKKVFFNDIVDSRPVNPHEEQQVIAKLQRVEHQKTLGNELDYLGKRLLEWNKEFPDLMMYVVPSNHDDFIVRWLNKGDFVKDPYNAEIGCELMLAVLKGENPIEYYLSTRFPKLKNLVFLNIDESFILNNVEWGTHGHKGANGSRGSKAILEIVDGNVSLGHSHSPLIYRGVYYSGCDCKLKQNYNKGQGSSWLHANVIQYENGRRQLIIKIGDKYKL